MALWGSCDKVEEPFLINKGPVGSGGGGEAGKRVILVEEFTGHRCTNCPEAAVELANLKAQYGEQLLVVAIHAGFFAWPLDEFTADYQTEAGTAISDYFGLSSNPSGMVSRMEFDGSRMLGKDEWQPAIASLLEEEALAQIAMESTYDAENRTAAVDVEMELFAPQEGVAYKFCLVAIENDIVSPQANNNPDIGETPTIHDWHHKHVLRGAVNGTWGEPVDVASGVVSKEYSYELPEAWNEDNCAFIGYLYRDDTKEILHAAEVHVKE